MCKSTINSHPDTGNRVVLTQLENGQTEHYVKGVTNVEGEGRLSPVGVTEQMLSAGIKVAL